MPDFLNVKNNASSILAANITDVATSLTVAAGEGARFPTANFHITIEDEILKCTTRSGDVLTVTRAQEGTAAATHASAKAVRSNITAAIIAELQTELKLHDKSCRVYHNASQDILTATWTTLAFNSELWDTEIMHDLVTNNSRITCKTAGRFSCKGVARFSTNATGARHVGIKKNGSWDDSAYAVFPAISGNPIRVLVAIEWQLVVGDYIEMVVYQDSGATLTTDWAPGFDFCWLAMTRLP